MARRSARGYSAASLRRSMASECFWITNTLHRRTGGGLLANKTKTTQAPFEGGLPGCVARACGGRQLRFEDPEDQRRLFSEMDDDRPPVFPTELERDIFGMAARSHLQCIPRLILVAWRVKSWLEPLLYETIIFFPPDPTPHLRRRPTWKEQIMDGDPIHSRDTLFPILQSESHAFFRHAALLELESKDAKLVLSHCRSIENLWLSGPYQMLHRVLSLVADLPLKKFRGCVSRLFGSEPQIDFSHRFFAQITHLALIDWPDGARVDPAIWSKLSLVPNLTHLSWAPIFLDGCLPLLRTCPSLRVLIVLKWGRLDTHVLHHPDRDALENDPRFVMMVMAFAHEASDWQIGTRTGRDYWLRVEEFVAKRKSGEARP
ncbi:hypothetical protein DFH09DRAFT_1095224 [Mycena vulgaris]|nr:hypothetical protein DFH09DRAFT_1095224 [Mycena vulgaris]